MDKSTKPTVFGFAPFMIDSRKNKIYLGDSIKFTTDAGRVKTGIVTGFKYYLQGPNSSVVCTHVFIDGRKTPIQKQKVSKIEIDTIDGLIEAMIVKSGGNIDGALINEFKHAYQTIHTLHDIDENPDMMIGGAKVVEYISDDMIGEQQELGDPS